MIEPSQFSTSFVRKDLEKLSLMSNSVGIVRLIYTLINVQHKNTRSKEATTEKTQK